MTPLLIFGWNLPTIAVVILVAFVTYVIVASRKQPLPLPTLEIFPGTKKVKLVKMSNYGFPKLNQFIGKRDVWVSLGDYLVVFYREGSEPVLVFCYKNETDTTDEGYHLAGVVLTKVQPFTHAPGFNEDPPVATFPGSPYSEYLLQLQMGSLDYKRFKLQLERAAKGASNVSTTV
ncbi:MAG TPA: hypothetical protein VEA59_01865 [Patescibacteria group bacterium]|nr:hypothetical protein [Patescibacteria group bacterium]